MALVVEGRSVLSQHKEQNFEGIANDDDDEEFPDVLVLSSETREKTEPAHAAPLKGRKPLNGLQMNAKDLLIELNQSKSFKERGPKSPARPAKYREKPAKCVSPKCTPQRIHQPR